MTEILYTLPTPSTALSRCSLEKLPKRACAVLCEYEDDSGGTIELQLLFEGVEAFKCTYLGACTVEMIRNAYDKVVDVGSSEWLSSVQGQLISYGSQSVDKLKHLMIYFDDGPCYEFICCSFRVEETVSTGE